MKEDRKTDGFKFALTALTTIGALLYAAVSYYQGTAIDIKYNDIFIELISVSLILFTNLLLYIFIKGYSFELHRHKDSDLIERNEKRASTIYILAFLTFIMLLSSIILIFVFSRLFGNLDSPLNYIIILLSALSSFFFGWPNLEFEYKLDSFPRGKTEQKLEKLYLMFTNTLNNKQQLKKVYLIFINIIKRVLGKENIQIILKLYIAILLLCVGFIYLVIVLILIINFPISGHVTLDMQSINYKNDGQISINIKVTGPIYDSQLKLYKENSENNFTLIDQLPLKPEHNSYRKISGNQSILSGNSFELGTYYSFINITNPNMTVGYYELIYTSSKHEYGKGFYLLNKSEV